jgi:membrane protein DedA with SNARE-associated domain
LTFFNIEDAVTSPFESLDSQFVYLGILFASFIVNMVILVPIPIYPILIISVFDKKLDPNSIAIYSATGIIIAKTIIFYLAYYGHNILFKQRSHFNKKIILLQKLASKYGWKAAIIAAVTPIPDDIVYISLGLARYSPWKFIISTFAGKLAINEIVLWAAIYWGKPFIDKFTNNNNNTIDPFNVAISVIVGISIAIVIIYTFTRIDMDRVIRKYFPRAFEDDNPG